VRGGGVGGRPQSAATKMSDSLTDGPAAGAMRRSQTGACSSAEAGCMEQENPEMHRATCTRRRRAAQPQPTIPILTQCRISWSRGASLATAAARRCGCGVVGPGGAPPRTGRRWRRPRPPRGSSAGSARSPTAALRRRPARRQPRGASLRLAVPPLEGRSWLGVYPARAGSGRGERATRPAGWTRRVQSVRGDGRDVSSQYGRERAWRKSHQTSIL
jgi:hypothetical protein